MFLTRMMRAFRRNVGESDGGSALVAVIGVAAVAIIITTMVSSVLINGMGFTSMTRASVQSQASADAGLAVAQAQLTLGACAANPAAGRPSDGVYEGTDPVYRAEIEYRTSSGTWIQGCPIPSAVGVRIVSNGTATALGVVGASSGDDAKVEALFAKTPTASGIMPSGVAMYLSGGLAVKNNAELTALDGSVPSVHVKEGDVTCDNNGAVQGDLIVAAGNLAVFKCTVYGDAWVAGDANLAQNHSEVRGTLTAPTRSGPGRNNVGTYRTSGPMPDIADWVDVGYDPTAWKDVEGIPMKVTELTGGSCSLDANTLNTASNGTKAVIVNAMGCPAGITLPSVGLKNDVVVFAPKFTSYENQTITSASGNEQKLWLITPDDVNDGAASCAGGLGDFTVGNGFTISSPVVSMLYTPCNVVAGNNLSWRGQVYAGGHSSWNGIKFAYTPVGVAGFDLTTGLPIPVVPPEPGPGTLLSMRNISG